MSRPEGRNEKGKQRPADIPSGANQESSEIDETFIIRHINEKVKDKTLNAAVKKEEMHSKGVKEIQVADGNFEESQTSTPRQMNILDANVPGNKRKTLEVRKKARQSPDTTSSPVEQREELAGSEYSFCDNCDRTLIEVDSLPEYFIAEAKHEKGDREKHKLPKTKACSCCNVCQQKSRAVRGHGSTNRYNNSHVQLSQLPKKPSKQWFSSCMFPKMKKYKHKNMAAYGKPFNNTDSGETLPQLYQAKMKSQQLSKVPELFKFRAVAESPIPHYIPADNTHVKAKKSTVKKAMKQWIPKKIQEDKEDESEKFIVKKITNDPLNVRACLNFDGTEYISTTELPQRIDIYCFDHLNTGYFRTTDQPPPLMTDEAIRKTEDASTRFWAEIFGFLHLFISFVIAFILQLYKFILFSFVRPLLSGLVQLTSDYLFKPFLTILYNGFTQPLLVFIFNIATSFRDVCYPIARGIGYFLSEFSVVLRAIRLVEWNRPVRQPLMKDSNC